MVFVSVNMMSWNDYGLWSQKDPGASPAGSRHHFCPLKTLGNIWRHFWLSATQVGRVLLAFTERSPGRCSTSYNAQDGTHNKRIIWPKGQ